MVAEVGIIVLRIVVNHIASAQVFVGILHQPLGQLLTIDKRHHALHVVLILCLQLM